MAGFTGCAAGFAGKGFAAPAGFVGAGFAAPAGFAGAGFAASTGFAESTGFVDEDFNSTGSDSMILAGVVETAGRLS